MKVCLVNGAYHHQGWLILTYAAGQKQKPEVDGGTALRQGHVWHLLHKALDGSITGWGSPWPAFSPVFVCHLLRCTRLL